MSKDVVFSTLYHSLSQYTDYSLLMTLVFAGMGRDNAMGKDAI